MSIRLHACAHNGERTVARAPRQAKLIAVREPLERMLDLAISRLRPIALVAFLALASLSCSASSDQPDNLSAFQAITSHHNAQEVTVEGTAAQVLPDSTGATGRHERFVIDVHSGNGDEQLILIAHNIDIAPRVPIQSGDDVIVRGELALDRSGPVIHFTHHDPRGRHLPGFIKVHGQTYE